MEWKKSSKLQSSMEYLMTYGWAVLIIAVVLGALFSLGVFSSSSTLTNACIPESGFLCTNLIFSTNTAGSTGDPAITATLGSTSAQWTNVYFAVVPRGQILTDTSIADESKHSDFLFWAVICGGSDSGTNYFSTFSAGEQVVSQMNFCPTIVSGTLSLGSHIDGEIWAMYSTTTTTNALVEIGSFSSTASTNQQFT